VIPRVFHHVWVGPKQLPDEFARYRKTWAARHPGWEMRLWTEDNLPRDLRRPEVYERLRVPAERADILRLEVLWREGGVYLDTDFECLRCIEPLIEGLDFFAAYLKPGRTNNAVIGAVPGHPILDRALDQLKPRDVYGYDKAAAGPHFFDSLLKDYPDVKLFEPAIFYPSTPEERERAAAIHHMDRSWKDAEGFKTATLVAERRYRRAQTEVARLEKKLARSEKRRKALEESLVDERPVAGRMAALRAVLKRSR
jgi:inositol phosphorylceramide mannosyltransferase catalytic subunit